MSRPHRTALLTLALLAAPAAAAPRVPVAKPAGPTEVHVVALYEGAPLPGGRAAGGTAAVVVDRPGTEVTLVLSAYEPVTWTVTATPTTTVKKVILAGYHRQSATVPEGAETVSMYRDGREGKRYLFVYYKMDSPRFRPAVQALRELTGQEVRSFQGGYRFDPANPLTVQAIQDDPRLASDYPRQSRTADVPKLQFKAVHLTPSGRYGVAGSFGDFTRAGPEKSSLKPLPDRVVRLANDPKEKTYYGLTDHEVHEVDLEKRTSTKLDTGMVRISRPRALTFDTKRERLLVVASNSLCEYVPATGKWRAVAELPRGTDLAGLAYHARDDSLYGVGQEFGGEDGGRPILYHLNAQGAVLKTTPLGAPMFPGVLGRYGPESRAQVVSVGRHLAVVVGGPAPRDENGKPGKAESFLFLINPEDETVTLSWKE